jgi:RNA polymerase sigma-70 factor, ECF subfamily
MLRTTLPMPPADARVATVEALVQEHQAGVRAFIRAIGVQEAWVDDVAQETFLVAYRKLHEWDRGRDAGQWLRGIARRLAANERRKGARRSRLLGGGLADRLIEHSKSDGVSPVAELLEAMHACLQELPESGRELLRRRYADGERTESLAANMQIRADSLRQKLHRLRLLVKGCVERKVRGTWA